MKKSLKICGVMTVFILGLLFTLTYRHKDLIEGFEFQDKCPNLLIKKGKEIHLVNTKKAMVYNREQLRNNWFIVS